MEWWNKMWNKMSPKHLKWRLLFLSVTVIGSFQVYVFLACSPFSTLFYPQLQKQCYKIALLAFRLIQSAYPFIYCHIMNQSQITKHQKIFCNTEGKSNVCTMSHQPIPTQSLNFSLKTFVHLYSTSCMMSCCPDERPHFTRCCWWSHYCHASIVRSRTHTCTHAHKEVWISASSF